MDYNPTELMICIASRQMEDGALAFIGTGVPMLAASLAKKTRAPGLMPMFEFGGAGSPLEKLPLGVGDVWTFHHGLAALGICDIMETAARGFVDYGFLGGAQIDMYGNLNSTFIGTDHDHPKVRLPGSGGACDVGSYAWKTIAIMKHDRRRFIPKLDFLTTPGYLDGPGSREAAGLPRDSGPFRVVTNLALMGYDDTTKRMMLLALNPGVTKEEVIENTGFDLIIPDHIGQIQPPTDKELMILRKEIDPEHLYI